MPKPLNIGMIGYGFMGRAHTNGYKRVNDFFDLPYRPVLKAACARDKEKVQAFADNWGYESIETDWRKLLERKDIDAVDVQMRAWRESLRLRGPPTAFTWPAHWGAEPSTASEA